MKRQPVISAIVLASLALVTCPHSATAHGFSLWCEVDSGEVHIEGFFSDGSKVGNARVTVYDAKRNKAVEGTTDDEGRFCFEPPVIEELKIVVSTGFLHKAKCVVTKEELLENAAGSAPEATPADGEPNAGAAGATPEKATGAAEETPTTPTEETPTEPAQADGSKKE